MDTIEITRPTHIKNYIINNDNFKFKYINMEYMKLNKKVLLQKEYNQINHDIILKILYRIGLINF